MRLLIQQVSATICLVFAITLPAGFRAVESLSGQVLIVLLIWVLAAAAVQLTRSAARQPHPTPAEGGSSGNVIPGHIDVSPAAPFYEPGVTYVSAEFPFPAWAFRCDVITIHPEDDERTALGWRFFKGEWSACAYGEDDWACGRLRQAVTS